MAPANQYGYKLLPSDDVSCAGGPQRVMHGAYASVGDDATKEEQVWHVKYDAGRHYHLSTPKCVIHPFHPAVQAWNALLISLLLFDIVYLPVETAFGFAIPTICIIMFDVLSTTLFSADIVLQFFLQIPSPTGDYWVFNHAKIIRAYLGGLFLVDLLSVSPFRLIRAFFGITSEKHPTRALRLTKLLRMVRLKRIAKRYEYDFNLTFTQRSIALTLGTVLVSLHILSCLWATFGNYQVGDDWLTYVRKTKLRPGEHFEPDTDISPVTTYIISIYFALYTLTGIGYGDIVPSTRSEYIFVTVVMLAGALLWASVIGEIVSVLRNANIDEVEYQETMDQLIAVNNEYKLPSELWRRLLSYISESRELSRMSFVQENLIARMSPELAIQFTEVLHGGWFGNIWWLRNVGRSNFMVKLTLAFAPMLYPPKECISNYDRLYVISHGMCIHGVQVLCKNQCWGTDFLLAQEHLRVLATTVSLTYLHTLYLTRELLQETLEQFPYERELVRRSYRSLCLMRGIVYHARSAQAEERRKKKEQVISTGAVRRDFVTQLGALRMREAFSVVQPSAALSVIATAEEVQSAIKRTRLLIDTLDEQLGKRLDIMQTKVQEAMTMLAEHVGRKGSSVVE